MNIKKQKNSIENRKARYNFNIDEIFEAGIILNGTEIKSIRNGMISIDSGYAVEKENAIWLINVHIQSSPNINQNLEKIDSLRPRKLLLKKKEIKKLKLKLSNQGYTLIPLNLHYNSKGFAKIDLGLSQGRKKADKREYKKEQDWKRQKERLINKKIG